MRRETTGTPQDDHKETTDSGDHRDRETTGRTPQGDHRDRENTGRPQGDHRETTRRPKGDHGDRETHGDHRKTGPPIRDPNKHPLALKAKYRTHIDKLFRESTNLAWAVL